MSLTAGAIIAGLGSTLPKIAEGALTVIKVIASVSFAVIFAGAITALFGLVQSAVMTSVVGEIFGIISMCLPFNPATIFSGLWLILDGILTFLIGRKLYILVSNLIKTSS